MLKLQSSQVFFFVPIVLTAAISLEAVAQVSVVLPAKTCQQLGPRNYVVLVNRPGNLLPQLPEFLAISAIPCGYMANSITFFGNFNNLNAASYRAEQLRQIGLDAIVHSFALDNAQISPNLRGASVIVEPNADPNLALQQVQAATNSHTQLVNFANRQVVLASPLSSFQVANTIASNLRSRGFASQAVSASLVSQPNAPTSTVAPPVSTPNDSSATKKTFRVLVPELNQATLGYVRAIASDAFPRSYQGRRYIQARTYTDLSNATRERDRFNIRFPGTIIISE
ncbi:SPOR domain-containing protein [Tumidithrix helvetica PCC 7403]|uniref:hypothetical protein n=1 Tax=Tumidithrix helvetica TaxID=3457545 RepID=UPI003CAA6F77